MKKLLFIIPAGFIIYLIGYYTGMREYTPHSAAKPSNQYELIIYRDHYTIMDGSRVVGYFTWEGNPKLDSIIKIDNQ